MNIGIPREILIEERRVALSPSAVHSLVSAGHKVYIEREAGLDSRFTDLAYQKVGGEIVFSHEEAFKRADMVIKVMPPTEEECQMLREEQIVFSFLQLGMRTSATMKTLISNKVTCVGTELIETQPGHKPILVAMSEIAGGILPQIAGRYLECQYGGRGILLGGVPGIPPATVVILGAGVVGLNATRTFLGLGAQVIVLDKNLERLRLIEQLYQKRAVTSLSTPYAIERSLQFADVLIGAVFTPGERPPILVTKELLKEMKKRALVIDVSIDQGGCMESSRPTTHSDPVFIEEEIIHYCVPNIPSAVSRTASYALSNVVLPYALEVADSGMKKALSSNPALRKGTFLYKGECTHPGVCRLFDLKYRDLEKMS
ncbi:MAG: alanine dehydrogenase [candidate division KSB1 bacterium]|nr:alanine dehydrogenase [candidate division KSB1 bacterium]